MIRDLETCFLCGKQLLRDEIGMYRKAVNKEAEACLCLDCLAAKYKVSRSYFEEKIALLKARGCTLFN